MGVWRGHRGCQIGRVLPPPSGHQGEETPFGLEGPSALELGGVPVTCLLFTRQRRGHCIGALLPEAAAAKFVFRPGVSVSHTWRKSRRRLFSLSPHHFFLHV